jgi:DNA polymerase III delta subunit
MIYFFHGENQPALRDALGALKKEYDESVFWTGELEDVGSYLRAPSFFAKNELVIIEIPKGSVSKKLLDVLAEADKDVALVFPDKLSARQVPKASEAIQVRQFRREIPKNVFPLLDALAAKKKKLALSHAQRLLKDGKDPQFILAMIIWQMRSLAKVKGKVTKGLHPYVLRKLKRAAESFSEQELALIFSLLLKEDSSSKRGKANSATLGFLIDRLTE